MESIAYRIDLNQLAIRESEQVEWKENVAEVDDVVATLSAFANDLSNLGGGYVVCGAAEVKDADGFASINRAGLGSDRLRQLEGMVLTRCRERVSPSITPLVDELPSDVEGRRILVFTQAATSHAHTFRDEAGSSKHYIRVSRSTLEARNGRLRDLLVRKGDLEPWDRRPCNAASVDDLDLLALRDALQRMRVFSSTSGIEPYLSSENALSPFVPPLFAREALTGKLRPRNFTLLLFGRDTQRFIPGALSLFSIYPGNDRSDIHAERHELAGTLLQQAARLSELLDVQSFTTFDKADTLSPNTVKYPKRALYEAMGNALAHRDYELSDPTRLTVFENRIEIASPGSLPTGVDRDSFRLGQAGPKWRNQTLAWFFGRLQLAQAEGQGIPTILRSMREEGCPPPALEPEDERVVCTLPAHPRHSLLREFRKIERAIALDDLPAAQEQVLRLLERDPLNFRALQLFAEVQHALRDPDLVFHVLSAPEMRIEHLPSSVLIELSDALGSTTDVKDTYRQLSARLLSFAARGQLEERELRRVAVAMLRNKNEQDCLDLIERNLKNHPEWLESASLLQLRGDAFLGLAKRCRTSAMKRHKAVATKERIWKEFRAYLAAAEKDLRDARDKSVDSSLNRIIATNLSYLSDLRAGDSERQRQKQRQGRTK
ncbi:MAG: ATP-binding protein [Janthinobacterium lividum]